MKRLWLMTTFVVLLCSQVLSQTTSTNYYYHKGERTELQINTGVVLVYFDKLKISAEEICARYDCLRTIDIDPTYADRLYAYEIALTNEDYENSISNLKQLDEVWDVEPVAGIDVRVPISRFFYLKLNSMEDTTVLKNMAQQAMANYEGAVYENRLWYALSVDKNSTGNALSLSSEFWETGLFAEIDPGFIFEIKFNLVPCVTDAQFTSQWGLYELDICPVWDDLGNTGDNVRVAIIDDGLSLYNQELQQMNIVASYNALGDNIPAVKLGTHGTLVTGVIFADHNNHEIAGVAPDADLINVSFAGNHTIMETVIASGKKAFDFAVDNSADVILCAWDVVGWCRTTAIPTLLQDAIQDALDNGRNGKGCVVVFAAGNDSPASSNMDICGVATLDSRIMVVGSMDYDHQHSYFSCYGDALDLVAPGSNILTTHDTAVTLNYNGTSMAASFAAGVAALMLSENPNLTLQQVDLLLKHNATRYNIFTYNNSPTHLAAPWNSQLGHGALNANSAVLGAQRLAEHELVIKDFSSDNGAEPSSSSYNVNNSPSIVVRDPSLSNQVVTTLSANHTYNVQVTVHNMGSSSVTLSPSDVSIYWSLNQSSMQWTQTWANCSSDCHCGSTTATGSQVTIQPGNSHTFTGQISIPLGSSPSCIPNQTQYTVSIVAVVDDGNPVLGINATGYALADFVRTSNNVAWKSNYTLYYGSVGPILPPIGITSITPNPTTGSTVIEYRTGDRNGEVVLLVTDVHGASIARETGTADACRMEMGNVHAGFYYVYLIVGGETLDVKPLIVN